MSVIISPFSKRLREPNSNHIREGPNPKDYPYWEEVVRQLHTRGVIVIQIGVTGERTVGADHLLLNKPLKELRELARFCDLWISVDNFWPHLASSVKRGIVLWGRSSPEIFGYSTNVNLVKREHQRPAHHQFGWWNDVPYDPSVFVLPYEVMRAVDSLT